MLALHQPTRGEKEKKGKGEGEGEGRSSSLAFSSFSDKLPVSFPFFLRRRWTAVGTFASIGYQWNRLYGGAEDKGSETVEAEFRELVRADLQSLHFQLTR